VLVVPLNDLKPFHLHKEICESQKVAKLTFTFNAPLYYIDYSYQNSPPYLTLHMYHGGFLGNVLCIHELVLMGY
jgi:hypothetical protein